MNRFKQSLARFFMGRRGMDELGIALYILGLVLYILALVTGSGIISWLSLACWIYGVYRMLSKNLYKRAAENEWFLKKYRPVQTYLRQAKARFKNRKIYKYYRCPKCHSMLKLPRGIGMKTVTCGKCGATFQKKA